MGEVDKEAHFPPGIIMFGELGSTKGNFGTLYYMQSIQGVMFKNENWMITWFSFTAFDNVYK